MERSPLSNSEILPNDQLIEQYLRQAYPVYQEFSAYVNSEQSGLVPSWIYYNDVKYWLCKVQYKKKTIFWLTVWEGYFKLTFYFTEKYELAIDSLEIAQPIKEQYRANKLSGKIKPVTLDITTRSQLLDAYALINFKVSPPKGSDNQKPGTRGS
jgi:hypothetical protein